MVTLKITNKATPRLISFSEKVWKVADMHYYGQKINWKKDIRFISAYEKKQLIGVVEIEIQAGVMHILDLIVDYDYQKGGIGTQLLKKAEELAREQYLHKIYLETGKTWEVRKFYEKMGYTRTGELPQHYGKQDYVEYTKFLSL